MKINLLKGRSAEEKATIASSIQSALVSTLEVRDADRDQLFNEYDVENIRHTCSYLGMTYSDQLLIVEITLLEGRDDQVKKSLLVEISHNLVAADVVGADDVFVMIAEIGRANVSFGRGARAQRPRLRSRSAEAAEENLKHIAVKRPTAESNAHPDFQFSSRTKRTSAPGTKPGYGATNLGRHSDDRIRRHAAVQPHERSGDASITTTGAAGTIGLRFQSPASTSFRVPTCLPGCGTTFPALRGHQVAGRVRHPCDLGSSRARR